MKTLETRYIQTQQLRLEDESQKIVGTIPFNSLSQNLGGFREKIKPGAFSKSLESGRDVRALFNHERDKPLARRSTNTLELHETEDGLEIAISPSETSWGRDAVEIVRHGDSDGFSFGFYVVEDEWSKQEGQIIRELIDADLDEVSVVFRPAYKHGKIAVRVAPETEMRVGEFWRPSLKMREQKQRLSYAVLSFSGSV